MKKSDLFVFFHVQTTCTWIYVLIIAFIIASCAKKYKVVESFPTEKMLLGDKITVLDSLYSPFAVYWDEGKLLFSTKGSYHVAIYDEKEQTIKTVLRKGNGHDEWIAPMITTQKVTIGGSQYTCVLERSTSKLYGINFEDNSSEWLCLQDFRKMNIPGIRNVFLLSDSTYRGIKDDEVCDLFEYSNKKKELKEEEIGIDHTLFSGNSRYLSQNMMSYNETKRKMAIAYYAFPYLLLLNENDSTPFCIIQIGESVPKYNKESSTDPHLYILDMCSTDKHIYMLYDEPLHEDKTSILVFDWEGNPIAKYLTNRMSAFAVDEENSRIYALNEDDTEGVCSVYYFGR